MSYLLDTNTCIRYVNRRSEELRIRFRNLPDDIYVAVSSVTKAEMYFGSFKSMTPDISRQKQDEFLSRFPSLPFDDAASDRYGRIRAILERSGTPIGHNDMMIAAIALANGLIIVTHNTR